MVGRGGSPRRSCSTNSDAPYPTRIPFPIPLNTRKTSIAEPPVARAGSASFEDPVLQAVYRFLAMLAAGRSEIVEAFCAYTEERIGMFLPPARAALISDVMLRHAEIPTSVEPPERRDHQVYVTINLVEAVSTLPEPYRSELDQKITALGWTAGWLETTRAFIGSASSENRTSLPDFLEFEQYPPQPGRIGLRSLPGGILRALRIEGHWFVRHDCGNTGEIQFSGLRWPAGHSQWLKESDRIAIGDQILDTATIGLFTTHRGEPSSPRYFHPSSSGITLKESGEGAISSLVWKDAWLSGGGTPFLPNDTLVIGGKKVPGIRLIRAALSGPRSTWSLRLDHATLRFPDGQSGLDDLTLALEAGDMVAVMGPSGCGKSTLMSVLSGELKLTSGEMHLEGTSRRKPSFALVPQDDVLFSELTAGENLRFAAALRSSVTDDPTAIPRTLAAVGLEAKGFLRVGSVTEKVLSGGERKRLNIGLELIGSPDALLLDEPTSGLSSADAGSVMKILRARADQGVLVMAVIHQPSPEVFSKFDKVIVLDVGGRLAYFGTPEGTCSYFGIHTAGAARQAWGPDGILDTLVGRRTTLDGGAQRRNFDPAFWKLRYAGARAGYEPIIIRRETPVQETAAIDAPAKPGLFKTALTLFRRELLRKVRSWRAIAASCLISVLLACIVAWVCRIVAGDGTYAFTTNRYLPAFCFLNVILVQFLALSSSVQELVKDRAHRMRERLLKVPGAFWLLAKLPGLAIQTSLQAALVVVAGGAILGLGYGKIGLWIALTLAGWASVALGLLVSALPRISERVALAAVPLMLVPQMILCGAQPFEFKDLAHLHTPFPRPHIVADQPAPPPWVAQGMPSRWAYQACITELRDDPALISNDQLKPLLRTYNFSRSLVEVWKTDPPAFLEQLSAKTGRKLSEEQVRHEISLLVLNDKRSSEEIARTFGPLMPDTSALKPIRNEFFLEYTRSVFPKTTMVNGRQVPAAIEARIMLGVLSIAFLLAAAAVMTLSPRIIIDLIALFRKKTAASAP